MSNDFCVATNPIVAPDTSRTAELERLGDEIAELAAHLDAATAHLLDLIREFDAPRRLGQPLPLVRGVAVVADRARAGRRTRARPRGAHTGVPAAAEGGARAW